MRIAVVDGQGGGMGKVMVAKLRSEFGQDVEIIALGTNAVATSLMLKAGANEGASGESALLYNVSKVDIIMGAIGIVIGYSMLGELTPLMAKAIAESPAKKILIPLNRKNIYIAGAKEEPFPHYVDDAIQIIKRLKDGDINV